MTDFLAQSADLLAQSGTMFVTPDAPAPSAPDAPETLPRPKRPELPEGKMDFAKEVALMVLKGQKGELDTERPEAKLQRMQAELQIAGYKQALLDKCPDNWSAYEHLPQTLLPHVTFFTRGNRACLPTDLAKELISPKRTLQSLPAKKKLEYLMLELSGDLEKAPGYNEAQTEMNAQVEAIELVLNTLFPQGAIPVELEGGDEGEEDY